MKIQNDTYFVNIVIIAFSLIAEADILFVFALLIWSNFFIYALKDLGNRSMLFAFLISFFTFLMGREVVQQYLSYKVQSFNVVVNNHLYISLILSLLSLMVGYLLYNQSQKKQIMQETTQDKKCTKEASVDLTIKSLSKNLYFISWFFAIGSKLVIAYFVASFGYSDYYTDFSEYLYGNTFLYVISKLKDIMPVALSVFFATLPTKKEITIPVLMYTIFLFVSLLTGQRSEFVLGMLFLMVYFLYRNKRNPEEHWITRKMVWCAGGLLPFFLVFFTAYSSVRFGGRIEATNLFNGILDFVYDQGVTGNVVKLAYLYKDRIPEQFYTLEFLHSGFLARILNITIYHGNSIEHAMYGGSFTHTLGYILLGPSYLVGRGAGSSYIAELFYDFGYAGVVIGNIIYGYIIARINTPITKKNIFRMSIRYYIITQILWAPRASLTGFLTNLIAPFTLVSFLYIFGLAWLLKKGRKGV